jgi:tRNA (guanine-N7-)-methyltransferase
MRRTRQHVNPFGLYSLQPREPLELPERVPIEIDLGCGDGEFTIARAKAERSAFVLGLDIRERFIGPGIAAIAESGLRNARLETCNLIVDAEHLFPRARVRRFFINFPDPFFKRRQHHRRWLSEETLAGVVQGLELGGELIYQSDVWELTVEAMGFFELSASLRNVDGAFCFAKERVVEQWTSRERACLDEGRPIWRLRYRRVG